MEFLLNIVWLVISACIVLLWKKGGRGDSADPRPIDRRTQYIALAMLILILLPVVSMTDDMHAMSTAEIEHVTRRADMLPVADQPADLSLPLSMRLLLLSDADLQPMDQVEFPSGIAVPLSGSIRQTAMRPPPAAI
ncbi:MAG TPA: hypothetical protein VHB45_15845 [Alloacidobacterium sp.]|nr:hypothetical protein [Alloacidobacterium sp.]